MENDLIRRSDVIFPDAQKPDINGELTDFQCGYNTALSKMKTRIPNIPSVDAVEVVRCGECKNWETDWEPSNFDSENPRYYCVEVDFFPEGDWFCKDGQRRKDGNVDG